MNIIKSKKTLKLEFSKWLLNRVKKFSSLWTLFKGVTMWAIWIKRIDLVFNNNRWDDAKLRNVMWELLIDHRKLEWQHVLQQIQKNPDNENTILQAFDRVWGPHHFICSRYGRKVRWCYNHLWVVMFLGKLWGFGWLRFVFPGPSALFIWCLSLRWIFPFVSQNK